MEAAKEMPELSCRQLAAWITDNGPGYVSRAFRDYLHLVGIRHIFASPSTPRSTGSWNATTRSCRRT